MLLFFLIYTLCPFSCSLQPSPPVWASFSLATHSLSLQLSSISSALYTVSYRTPSQQYSLPPTSTPSVSIPCAGLMGSFLDVWYTVTLGTEVSSASPLVTFMCAGLPVDLSGLVLVQSSSRLLLSWSLPDQSAVGTELTAFYVYRSTGTWQLLTKLGPTTQSYVDMLQTSVIHQYKVSTVNWVGESTSPAQASITPLPYTSAGHSLLGYPTTAAATFQPYDVSVIARDSTDKVNTAAAELLFFLIKDVCFVPASNVECIRVPATDPNYQADILGLNGLSIQMHNSGDGTYRAVFSPTYTGLYSGLVALFEQGGLWSEWWDNVYLSGVPVSSGAVAYPAQTWGAKQLITKTANSFVSLKLTGWVRSPVSEAVAILVVGRVKVYWQGRLSLDSWEDCCSEHSFTQLLVQGDWYQVKVEWRQLEGEARYSLKWASASIPPQVIPSQYLFYPVFVPGSPWLFEAVVGSSDASKCYARGFDAVFAGNSRTITLFSVNGKGEIEDHPSDLFTIQAKLGSVEATFTSYYSANGLSYADISLTLVGIYTLTITLYDLEIQGSPYSLEVLPQVASPLTSTSSLAAFLSENGPVVCGQRYSFPFVLKDQYLNSAVTASVELLLTFEDPGLYVSSINVLPPSDWNSQYLSYFQHINSEGELEFSVFQAGNYQATVQLQGTALAEGAVALQAGPGPVFPQRTALGQTPPTITAGDQYTFYVQTRDEYYNVALVGLSSLASVVCTASKDTISTPISLSDYLPGVLSGAFTLSVSGVYTVSLAFNGATALVFSVTVTNTALNPAQSSLSAVPSTVLAGTVLSLILIARDVFSNPYVGVIVGLSLTVTGQSTGSTVPVQVESNGNGTYSVQFQPKRVDSYTVSCSVDGTSLAGNGQTFTVTESLASGLKTTLSLSSKQTVGQGSVQISSFDAYGNAISNPVKSPLLGFAGYRASFYGPASYIANATFADFTQFSLPLEGVMAVGTYEVVVGLEEQGGLLGFYYANSDFTGLVAALPYSNAVGIEPQKYSSRDATLDFDWSQNGPSLLSGALSGFSIRWIGALLPAHTETLSLIFTVNGLLRVYWNGGKVLDTLTPSTPVTIQRTDVQVRKNVRYALVVEFVAAASPAGVKLEWFSGKISRQIVPKNRLFSLINADQGPFPMETESQTIDPGRYTFDPVENDPFPLYEAGIGNLKQVNITLYDKYHNKLTKSATIFAEFTTTNDPITITVVSPSLQTLTFTPTSQGLLTMTIWTVISSINRLVGLYEVSVGVGLGVASQSSLTGEWTWTAGSAGSVLVTVKDWAGNVRTQGGDVLTVGYQAKAGTGTVTDTSTVDNQDGTYTLSFKMEKVGIYTVSVTMNGNLLDVLSQDLTVVPASPSPENSLLTVQESMKLDDTLSITVQIRDLYSNFVTTPQLLYGYVMSASNPYFRPLQFRFTSTDLTTGTYTGSVLYSAKDADSSGTCKPTSTTPACKFTGNLSVFVYLMAQGIQATYYPTQDLTGDPMRVEIVSLPKVNWTASPVSDFTPPDFSVQWLGHLQSSVQGSYSFALDTTDSVALTIKGSTIIDTSQGLLQGSASLEAALFHTLDVTLMSETTSPKLEVLWEKPTETVFERLAMDALFHTVEPPITGSAVGIIGTDA